jgi:hypothetical protein
MGTLSAIIAGLNALSGLGDAFTGISRNIADARIAALQAGTEKEKIEQEERVKALEARRDVLKAESDGRVNAIIRAALAFPVIVFLWKVIIWDKVLALGSTDDLSENLWYVSMMVLGFYYVHWTVGRVRR